MLKTIARLEHKIGDKIYHLTCDSDSPLHEVKEACCQFIAYVGKIDEAVKEAQAKADAEKAASEVKEPEVVEEPEIKI